MERGDARSPVRPAVPLSDAPTTTTKTSRHGDRPPLWRDVRALAWAFQLLVFALVIILIACVGKLGGVFIGSRFARLTVRDGLAIGAGMNARGALEIIVATVGYSIGVLTASSYTIIVMVALTTSALAPPMLRYFVKDWRGTKQEQERLDREEALVVPLLLELTAVEAWAMIDRA